LPLFRGFVGNFLKKGVITPNYTIQYRKSNEKTWSEGMDKPFGFWYDKV
jgi:hypothetical protein